jgi:hypothetical protein
VAQGRRIFPAAYFFEMEFSTAVSLSFNSGKFLMLKIFLSDVFREIDIRARDV